MKKIIILTLALALVGSILLAQKAEKKMNMSNQDKPMMKAESDMCDMKPGFWMDELKLSSAVKTKLEAQKIAFRKQMNTHEAELENLRLDLMLALKNADFIKIKALNKQISDKQLVITNARTDHFENILKELNTEQKEIFKKHLPMMFKGDGQGHRPGAPMMHKGGGGGMMGDCGMGNMQKHKPNLK